MKKSDMFLISSEKIFGLYCSCEKLFDVKNIESIRFVIKSIVRIIFLLYNYFIVIAKTAQNNRGEFL